MTTPDPKDARQDGEWFGCNHCDGTGKQEGPGGDEDCCHCRGKGEVWIDDADRFEDDE